jgi:glutamate N-acetyltransferase/amino-acid N-acetyltransferase
MSDTFTPIKGDCTSPDGFLADGGTCGLKASGRPDVGAIVSTRPATSAATFTSNLVKAAPVLVSREHLQVTGGTQRAIVFNSGNANAATGAQGLADARQMAFRFCDGPGAAYGVVVDDVFVASTGVIGVPLDMERLGSGIAALNLTADGGQRAVSAMMTTDTVPKAAAATFVAHGRTVTVGGIAKGAAMIAPHMATMLAFVTTDAAVEARYLQGALTRAVDASFNMIIIDGDMSTNDTCFIIANGTSWGGSPLDGSQAECATFEGALGHVCGELARAMARDGEGSTKFIVVDVTGAATVADARRVARTIAGSNLTKSAVLGADPNWGRIACAAGYSGAPIDPNRLEIAIGGLTLVRDGVAVAYDADVASARMKGREVHIAVGLHLGESDATAWGCDLTPEYVRLNSDYTT